MKQNLEPPRPAKAGHPSFKKEGKVEIKKLKLSLRLGGEEYP
jgi:hypothetical protein